MKSDITVLPEVLDDLRRLDETQLILIRKAIQKSLSFLYPNQKAAMENDFIEADGYCSMMKNVLRR